MRPMHLAMLRDSACERQGGDRVRDTNDTSEALISLGLGQVTRYYLTGRDTHTRVERGRERGREREKRKEKDREGGLAA